MVTSLCQITGLLQFLVIRLSETSDAWQFFSQTLYAGFNIVIKMAASHLQLNVILIMELTKWKLLIMSLAQIN